MFAFSKLMIWRTFKKSGENFAYLFTGRKLHFNIFSLFSQEATFLKIENASTFFPKFHFYDFSQLIQKTKNGP